MLAAFDCKRLQYAKLNVGEWLQEYGVRTVFPVKDKGNPSLKMEIPKRVSWLRYLPHRIAHLLNIARSPVDKSKHTFKKNPRQATASRGEPGLGKLKEIVVWNIPHVK